MRMQNKKQHQFYSFYFSNVRHGPLWQFPEWVKYGRLCAICFQVHSSSHPCGSCGWSVAWSFTCPAVLFPKIGSGSLRPCLVCCKGVALYLMSLWTCTKNETHLQPSFHFSTWLGVGCFTSTCVYHMTGFGDRHHFLCRACNFSVAKHSASFLLI